MSYAFETPPEQTRCEQTLRSLCNAVDLTREPVIALKQVLNEGNSEIDALFRDGAPIDSVVRLQTLLVDSVLLHIWHHVFSAEQRNDMALVAVGGYGRGELHPHSDVDIMVLLRDGESRHLNEQISGFITQLWDLGLDIGHSVRTVDECISESISDLSVITNLMEARLLDGNQVLFTLMAEAIEPGQTWNAADFLRAKLQEQANRRVKFQDTAYRLEPNLKESPGGLRDIQTIGWISRRYFGTERIRELVDSDFINEHEYNDLLQGLHLLWEIRYVLHRLAGRREDRLLFDHQRSLAHHFGYTNDEHNASIEAFMQRYYRTVIQMQRLNEIILQKFQEIVQEQDAPPTIEPINERFRLHNGYLEATSEDLFERHPEALLEIFQVYARSPEIKGVRANTIRLIRANLHLIDDDFRERDDAKQLFMQIFRDPKKLTRKLRRMNRYGVMAAYLPDYENIVGRMQYDLFHIFTVDEHTTRVIRNLRRFALPNYRGEMPHCSMIMDQIKKPELLYLIGLYHDIAKGRGGDHSELGAEMAREFCQRHGVNKVDTDMVAWVVQNHLLMSMTAQRRDITDPDVIHDFALRVRNRDNLNHLYLLTVADIRGTNPELWNSWKENLLRDLFRQAARALHRGLDSPLQKDDAIELKKDETRDVLIKASPEIDFSRVDQLWTRLGEEYFLRYFAKEIAWHTEAILEDQRQIPLVKLRPDNDRGATEILIYTHDHAHLFALMVSLLDRAGLNIVSANVGTTAGNFALNTFTVLEHDDTPASGYAREEQIRKILFDGLQTPDKLPEIEPQRVPRRLKHFNFAPTVTFDNEVSDRFTSLHIEAADRPGVLSRFGRSFLECDILVHSAKVATLGEKIEDVFFITDEDHHQLRDETQIKRLRESIVASLTEDANTL
ncbi:[protein-PII] uridylyltransferase [Granulosicoccaceae sp. 1_MG-2023]|nr:[protein-PII] uridylyltransferase [Granulosicoccaceae sp. 1_MG-2023]